MINTFNNLYNNSFIKDIIEFLILIENTTENFFIVILLRYLIILISFKVLFITLQIILDISQIIIKKVYKKTIQKNSLSKIRIYSEIFYIIDKFLYKITPRAIPYYSQNKISPIKFLKFLKRLFLIPFKISFLNICIWILVAILSLREYINFDMDNVVSNLKDIDFRFINAISSLSVLVLSFAIIFLFRSSSIQAKAKKKIYDDMYEKVFTHQIILSTNLSKILSKSEKNLDLLNNQINTLTTHYCECLSCGTYTWNNDQLVNLDNRLVYNLNKNQDFFSLYEDFNLEQEIIASNLKEFENYRIISIYNQINNPIIYELINLHISPFSKRTNLNYLFINKDSVKDLYESKVKNSKYIYENMEKSVNKIPLEVYENLLRQEILDFNGLLKDKLASAIYSHIIGWQCVEFLENNTTLRLKDWILNK